MNITPDRFHQNFLRLQYERLTRGWTQKVLAEKARLHQSQIALIERGQLIPTDEQLDALAFALQIAPAVLLRPLKVVLPEIEEAR